MGSVANLALVDAATNRRRRKETVPEYFARPSAKRGPTTAERAEIERYLLCLPTDLGIPQVVGKDALPLADYRAFLEARWTALVTALYASLGI